MLIYILIFILIACLAIEYEIGSNKAIWPFFIIVGFLVLFAGFRSPDVPRDYKVYAYTFTHLNDILKEGGGTFFKVYEPAFIWVVLFFKWLFTHSYIIALMLFFACSAVTLKSVSILNYSFNPFLALLIYYSSYFFLHEMIQIRIGLASAIYLFSLRYYFKGEFKKFIGFILLAFCFHYSAVFFLGTLLFRRNNFNKTWFTILMVLVIPFAILRIPFDNYLSFTSIFGDSNEKFDTYSNIMKYNLAEGINVFNAMNIIKIVICAYLLYIVPKKDLINEIYLSLFLKLTIVSVFILAFTSGIPFLSFRLSDLFGIASIFSFAYLAKYLPFRKFNIWIVVLIAFAYFYISVIYGGIVNPYAIYPL